MGLLAVNVLEKKVERDVEINTLKRFQDQCNNAQATKQSLENKAHYYKGVQKEALLQVALLFVFSI